MNTVNMKYSVGTLIRYPLLFGGILAGFTFAFMNRDKFLADLEDERKRLDRTDEDSKQMLLDTIDSVNKARTKR